MEKENQFLFQRNLSYSCVHVVGRLCSQAGFDVGSDGWVLHCVWLDCAQILPATHQPPLWGHNFWLMHTNIFMLVNLNAQKYKKIRIIPSGDPVGQLFGNDPASY